jgi:hypothetical protein
MTHYTVDYRFRYLVLVLPELVLIETVHVSNVWTSLCIQIPLLAVRRAAGYAGCFG